MGQYLDIDKIENVEELREIAKQQNGKYIREAELAERLERRLQEKERETDRLFNLNTGHLDTIAYLANKMSKLEMALEMCKER